MREAKADEKEAMKMEKDMAKIAAGKKKPKKEKKPRPKDQPRNYEKGVKRCARRKRLFSLGCRCRLGFRV